MLRVSILELAEGFGILFLGLKKILVPLLVELLVLLDVSLFTLLSLLGLIEDQFTKAPIVVLLLEFSHSVFGHLCFDVLAFFLAGQSVILKNSTRC